MASCMREPMHDGISTATSQVERGNRSLRECEWEEARASFEAALALDESPEALEGLGSAAWWLDDGATVFDARERAYLAYRERGDRRAAGRVATIVAQDHFLFRG